MLSLVQPRWFIPVHGERRHLAHHAKLAAEVGIPPDHVLICEDGDLVGVRGPEMQGRPGQRQTIEKRRTRRLRREQIAGDAFVEPRPREARGPPGKR